jgi:hypothetical protein
MTQLFNLIIVIVILFVPTVGFCQTKDKTAVDCSVPETFIKVRPHPKGTPTEIKLGFYFTDIDIILRLITIKVPSKLGKTPRLSYRV